MKSASLILATRFELSTYFLVLTYEVENRGQRDAYLLNRLYSPTPRWNFSQNLIYVQFLTEKSTIWLSKRIANIPPDRSVHSPAAPFVTPLRAGERFVEEVNIPIPIREYHQYSPLSSPRASPEERNFRQVYFSLDYYFRTSGMREEVRKLGNKKMTVTWAPKGVQLEFGRLSSPIQNLNIKTLDV